MWPDHSKIAAKIDQSAVNTCLPAQQRTAVGGVFFDYATQIQTQSRCIERSGDAAS